MGLVDSVRQGLDSTCVAQGSLVKAGCRVSLGGAPDQRLVLDFDRPEAPTGPGGGRCDYLFVADDFRNTDWVAPIECKRGALKTSQVVKQLRAGAAVAEDLIPSGSDFRFRPIAATGSVPKAERQQLKKSRNFIRCHGKLEAVRLIKCGDKLIKGLSSP